MRSARAPHPHPAFFSVGPLGLDEAAEIELGPTHWEIYFPKSVGGTRAPPTLGPSFSEELFQKVLKRKTRVTD